MNMNEKNFYDIYCLLFFIIISISLYHSYSQHEAERLITIRSIDIARGKTTSLNCTTPIAAAHTQTLRENGIILLLFSYQKNTIGKEKNQAKI